MIEPSPMAGGIRRPFPGPARHRLHDDPDIVRREGLRGSEGWMRLLGATRFIGARCRARSRSRSRPACGRLAMREGGPDARCSPSATPPRASTRLVSGIVKALRSGLFAAYSQRLALPRR